MGFRPEEEALLEKVFDDFFKSLRIAINNSTVYFKDHPVFVSSIESLKEKICTVLEVSSPFKIGIMPLSLIVSEKTFEKQALYVDLAQHIHRRKIKTIEFLNGISSLEVNIFITKIALPSIDLIKEGGLSFALQNEGVSHIFVEELDYFSLLKAGGIAEEERKDVWAYLLNRAVKENNQKEIEEFSQRKLRELLK